VAYAILLPSGRYKAAWKNAATGKFKRKTLPKGKSKKEAEKIAFQLEDASWKQHNGLAVAPVDSPLTLAELCRWWLSDRCPAPSKERETSRLKTHVLEHELGGYRLAQADSAELDSLFHEIERDGAAPGSINKLRSTLSSVFSAAIDAKKWTGANPLAAVKTRTVTKGMYQLLRAEEVAPALSAAGSTWRDICATAIYLALRKGELFGMQKEDVNLPDLEITITRSHKRNTTKGGKAVVLPIPKPLVQYLKHAIATAKGSLLFPRADGSMRHEKTHMETTWRRILVRAGIVIGYRHTCRRCVAMKRLPATHEFSDATPRRCPTQFCGMKMWPAGIPRPMRFHDLRHTTATLLLRAGVPIQHVQRILRHADIRTTVGTYGHLSNEDLRAPLALLPDAPALKEEPVQNIFEANVPSVCQPRPRARKHEGPGPAFSAESGAYSLERNTGFEPATFALARRRSTS